MGENEVRCGDVHDKAHWEDRPSEELDQPGVGFVDARRTSSHDLREKASEREHYTRRDLQPPHTQCNELGIRTLDSCAARYGRLTALKKTRSARVLCFATPLSIIATATWTGFIVLGGSRLAIGAKRR